jgi:hypothetical protein
VSAKRAVTERVRKWVIGNLACEMGWPQVPP